MSDARARPWYEVAFGPAYPVIYGHRDRAEAAVALELARRLLGAVPAGPWLDLGCGQGRHLAWLRQRGQAAVGLDLSGALLAQARRDDPGAPLLRADMRRLPLADRSCAAVLSLFTAFGYFETVAAHAPVVAEIARILAPAGAWLLDFLDADRVAAELAAGPRTRQRVAGPLAITETRGLATTPRRVVKRLEVTVREGEESAAAAMGIPAAGLDYEERVLLFTREQLDALATDAGLVPRAAAGSYTGGELEPGQGDRWLLVYHRPHREG